MDLLLDAVCVVDREGRFMFVSAACERIFGYTPEEMVGLASIDLVHPDDRERTRQAVREILSGELKPHFENRYVRKDGRIAHIMWSARWSEADQVRVAVARDITERKRAEARQTALYAISEAANTAEDLAQLYPRIHEVVNDLLPAGSFCVAVHDAESGEIDIPYCADQSDSDSSPHMPEFRALITEVVRSGQGLLLTPGVAQSAPSLTSTVLPWPAWLGVPLESGNDIIGALAVYSSAPGVRYNEEDKELLQFVSVQVASAIERSRTHSQLRYMAQYDQLTDLPNRALFMDRLKAALARARMEDRRLAVLYLDMDEFKKVNDTHGHATGDLLLREVARRLKRCVRESDTVGRLGGDEFIVLLEGIADPQDASVIAGKILSAVGGTYELDGVALYMSPSIGTAVYPGDGEDENQLIRHADNAMYMEKKRGVKSPGTMG